MQTAPLSSYIFGGKNYKEDSLKVGGEACFGGGGGGGGGGRGGGGALPASYVVAAPPPQSLQLPVHDTGKTCGEAHGRGLCCPQHWFPCLLFTLLAAAPPCPPVPQDIGRAFWVEHGKGQREKKERLVMVDGYAVLRENMYSMSQVRAGRWAGGWMGAWVPGCLRRQVCITHWLRGRPHRAAAVGKPVGSSRGGLQAGRAGCRRQLSCVLCITPHPSTHPPTHAGRAQRV